MAYDHFYQPLPCSHRPENLLHAVGTAYREARGQGLNVVVCLDLAEAVYIAAGGPETGARDAVVDMIASLSAECGDWLWEPAQKWLKRHVPAVVEMQEDVE